jgi:hypothetical protein
MNPFCTRRIRPGALPFIFPSGQDAELLIDRLRRNEWCGEITGPHGAGKSSLLAVLVPALERVGRRVVLFQLHDGQRRLPPFAVREPRPSSSQPTSIVADGYEQLSRWNRWRFKRLCRKREWGLVVTAHATVGLPELYRLIPTPNVAKQIVDRLLAGQTSPFTAEEVSNCFTRSGGNLREMLFDLYDKYEQQHPTAGQKLT